MPNNKTSFELKLIVIAILIPIFLELFPKIINQITFPPFTFLLPLSASYILGFIWFLVLLLGLAGIVNKKYDAPDFKALFKVGVYLTFFSIIIIATLYSYEAIKYIISLLSPVQVTSIMKILTILMVITSIYIQIIYLKERYIKDSIKRRSKKRRLKK